MSHLVFDVSSALKALTAGFTAVAVLTLGICGERRQPIRCWCSKKSRSGFQP